MAKATAVKGKFSFEVSFNTQWILSKWKEKGCKKKALWGLEMQSEKMEAVSVAMNIRGNSLKSGSGIEE